MNQTLHVPRNLQLGCVPFLNAKPLIPKDAAQNVIFRNPSLLADELSQGLFDVALVPIFELFSQPTIAYKVVDDVAIACDGAVYSVLLIHQTPIEQIHTVHLDSASKTSVHLLKVLLAHYYHVNPTYAVLPSPSKPQHLEPPKPGEAYLLIGDPAIYYRDLLQTQDRVSEFSFFDLGEEWKKATGLPFVFAAWLIHPKVNESRSVAELLREWRRTGTTEQLRSTIQEIESSQIYPQGVPEFYLSQSIRYRLEPSEKKAMVQYSQLLEQYGFIESSIESIDAITFV